MKWPCFMIVLFSITASAQIRMIPHITRAGGDFNASLILANTGTSASTFVLNGYEEDGTALPEVRGELAQGETRVTTPEALFGTSSVSHFSIGNDDLIDITIAYQDKDGNFSPSHVRETDQTSYRWRIYPGGMDDVIDGLAVVNTDLVGTVVNMRQINGSGDVLDEALLFSGSLSSNAKGLYVFNTDFIDQDGYFYEVYANSPLALTALRFANGSSRYFWEVGATPLSKVQVMQVGSVANLVTKAHGVSGRVTVANARTLRFENFNFDGGGIIVFIYLAKDGDYRNSGFPVGEDLKRATAYNNESFDITLPADRDLEQFNSISIWCVTAAADFGSGLFENP